MKKLLTYFITVGLVFSTISLISAQEKVESPKSTKKSLSKTEDSDKTPGVRKKLKSKTLVKQKDDNNSGSASKEKTTEKASKKQIGFFKRLFKSNEKNTSTEKPKTSAPE